MDPFKVKVWPEVLTYPVDDEPEAVVVVAFAVVVVVVALAVVAATVVEPLGIHCEYPDSCQLYQFMLFRMRWPLISDEHSFEYTQVLPLAQTVLPV